MSAAQEDSLLTKAVNILKKNGVISYPTEGVWGLGCDPLSRHAVNRILLLKNRAEAKGLILIGSRHDQFANLIEKLSDEHRVRFMQNLSRPTTWILPTNKEIPCWISGNHESVAVRVTDHPIAQKLCSHFGRPIVSTSCNPQGVQPAINQQQVINYFGDKLDFIVPGDVGNPGSVSDIIELTSNKIIRLG